MRTYCIAQELDSTICDDVNGKEIQGRGGVCIRIVD